MNLVNCLSLESIEVWYLPPQFGSTPKKAIPQPVSTVRQPKSIQDMDHGELFELVQKLLKEKEEKPKPQAHLHPNPPPTLDFTESGNITQSRNESRIIPTM